MLTGSNFKKWKVDLEIILGIMDLDLSIREDMPHVPAVDASTDAKAKYDKWCKVDRLSLMIMRRSMTDVVRGGIPLKNTAKEYLEEIKAKFTESKKAETRLLMGELTNMKYLGEGNVREHIFKMIEKVYKLRELEMVISDDLLIHMILNSLVPQKFKSMKDSYNTSKDAWTLNDLIAFSTRAEETSKREMEDTVQLMHMQKRGHNYKKHRHGNTVYKSSLKHKILPSQSKMFQVNSSKGTTINCYFLSKSWTHEKRLSQG